MVHIYFRIFKELADEITCLVARILLNVSSWGWGGMRHVLYNWKMPNLEIKKGKKEVRKL